MSASKQRHGGEEPLSIIWDCRPLARPWHGRASLRHCQFASHAMNDQGHPCFLSPLHPTLSLALSHKSQSLRWEKVGEKSHLIPQNPHLHWLPRRWELRRLCAHFLTSTGLPLHKGFRRRDQYDDGDGRLPAGSNILIAMS